MNPRQAKFVQEYLVDLNATQAARRAGYSKKTAAKIGWENLQKPEIAGSLAEALAIRAGNVKITAQKVLTDMEVARQLALVNGKYASAIRAGELCGRHVGLFTERLEHSGPNGGPIEGTRVISIRDLPAEEREQLRLILLGTKQRGQVTDVEDESDG